MNFQKSNGLEVGGGGGGPGYRRGVQATEMQHIHVPACKFVRLFMRFGNIIICVIPWNWKPITLLFPLGHCFTIIDCD